ncbi:hypothetical protein Q7P37_007074 [Cladosporium fusiforme]
MTPGLLDLPSELLEKIGHELTPVDLLHLRLTSRRLESSSQYSFAKRFFSHRAFILKDPGELAAISQKPDIAVALRSLSIRCRHEGFTIDRDDPLVPEGGAPLTYRLTAVFESTQTAVIFSRLTKLQSIEFKPMLKGNWHNLSLANVTGSLSTVLVALKVNSIKPDRIWMCEQFPAPATVGVVDLASLEQLGEGLFELRELGLSILTVPPESYVTGRFRRLYQVGRQLSHCIPHLRSLIYLHLTFDQMSSGTPVLHWLGRVAQPLPALTRFQLDKCKTYVTNLATFIREHNATLEHLAFSDLDIIRKSGRGSGCRRPPRRDCLLFSAGDRVLDQVDHEW